MKHMKLFLMTCIFAIVSSNSLAQQNTSTSTITVNVQGMVCDFCARGLEKVFGKRDEVNKIHVNMSDKLITVDLKAGATLDDETISELVISNGISVESINR